MADQIPSQRASRSEAEMVEWLLSGHTADERREIQRQAQEYLEVIGDPPTGPIIGETP